MTTMICGFSLGAAVGGFVAAAIIPRFGWQAVFIVGGVAPLLIAGAAFLWLPDSIRFLLVKGGKDERARALSGADRAGCAASADAVRRLDESATARRALW